MKYVMLSLLKDARFGKKSAPQPCDYTLLRHLAQEHQVSALIFNQIYHFPDLPAEQKADWTQETLQINALQAMRSSRFLQIYRQLRAEGVKALVVKGLILRNLYPQPDSRPSGDEDLYVPLAEFQRATEILQAAGVVLAHEGKEENIFDDPVCGLHIELHGMLFDREAKAFGQYQALFEEGFQDPVEHQIQGVPVLSLSYDRHFLFLVTHLTKHFLACGVGIRQILDIVMYAEAYREQIDWEAVYATLEEQGLLVLTANVMAIGREYFAMDPAVPIPSVKTDCEALLEDILDAGVFGKSSNARLHSSAFTLEAAEGQEKASTGTLLRHLFPPLRSLRERMEYTYLRKKPWLLPYAWVKRIHLYLHHRESGVQERDMMAMGTQRVKLLKKYGVIK